tara:strand:- start:195261 stop:195419 length:159 start_codon:yes stop_codon:yes gene_type:complete
MVSLLDSNFFGSDVSGIGLASLVSVLEDSHTRQAVKPIFLAAARSEAQPVME